LLPLRIGTLRLRLGLRLGLRLLALEIWPLGLILALGLILTLEVRALLAGVRTFDWRSLWRRGDDSWSELALRPLIGVASGLVWGDRLSLRGGLRLAVMHVAGVSRLSRCRRLWLTVVGTASRLR
jgi:hypothetical protein